MSIPLRLPASAALELPFEERGRHNGEWVNQAGIRYYDYDYYTPPSDVTTLFPCTPSVKGRLYPPPSGHSFFILDFVDHDQGARVVDTGLTIYDRGQLGRVKRRPLGRLGLYGEHGTMDIFMLNCERVVEIVDEKNERVKTISFSYLDSPIAIPILG